MSEYTLGLVSVSFRDKTPEEILQQMNKAGLTCIEWGSDIHAKKDDIFSLTELVKLQEKYNINCCSYGTYFKLGETDINELYGYIDAAKILGTNVLRLWCGNNNSEEYTFEERNELMEECKKASLIAESRGVILCMECHNNTFTNSKESALELMKTVNSKSFRMYWQPHQLKSFEENISYAKEISVYTENIHVFNWDKTLKFPLADGITKWKDYLKFFNDKNNLLLEFMPDGKIESLIAEANALRKIVGD